MGEVSFSPDTPLAVEDEVQPAPRRRINPLKAAAVLSAAILLSRLVGLVNQSVVSATLTEFETDAFKTAFRIIDFVNYLVAGGAMSVTFIPIFTELKEKRGDADAWKFFSAIASVMSLALLAIIGLAMILVSPVAAHLLNLSGESLRETVAMTRIMLPAQLFFYLGGMIVGVLNAHKRFGASALTGATYTFVALCAGVLFYYVGGREATGFAWGILLGAFCGNFLLPFLAARRGPREERLRFQFRPTLRAPGVKAFFRNAIPIMLGVSFPVVDQMVMPFFTSHIPGAYTQLDNGNRMMVAPLAMLAQAASVAAFPYLSSDIAAGKWHSFAEFLRNGLRRLMFISLPASALLILLSQSLVYLVFRHGNYSEAAAQNSAQALAFFSIGMFAWAGQQFIARGLYALQDTKTPTIIGTLLTIFFFLPLCWVASRTSQPIVGLSLATSIGACAHFCGVWWALERKLEKMQRGVSLKSERVLGTTLRTLAACVVMGVAGAIVKNLCDAFLPHDHLNHFFRILFISPVALVAFAWAAQKFRIPEYFWLRDKFGSRFKIQGSK